MTMLYDARGRALDLDALRREHADPERNDRLRAVSDSVASTLTPERLAGLMAAADEGDVEAYLTLAEEMEEREPQYRSTLSQRKFAVCSSQVVVEAASDAAKDQAIADDVRELVRDDAFARLLFHMQDALGKCYSVTETLWDTDGLGGKWWPRDYRWRDPRWYRLDNKTLSALRLIDDTMEGEALPPGKYVVHHPLLKSGLPVRGGLARLVAIAYVAKRFSVPALVRFLEVYGIPARVGYYTAGTSEEEQMRALRELRRLGQDAAAMIPEGVKVELLEVKGRGGPAEFVRALDWWDAQISKAVVGQTMTTDSGSSRAQSQTHYSVRVDFTQHDNRQSAGTINRDLIRPFVDLNHGPQERYPRVLLQVEEAEDLRAFATSVSQLVDRGLEVDQREVRLRLGLSDPEDGATLLRPATGGAGAAAPRPADDDPEPEAPGGDEDVDPEEDTD